MVAGRFVNLGSGTGPERARVGYSGLIDRNPSSILMGSCAFLANRVAVYQLIECGIPAADVRKYASAVSLLHDDRILSQITGLSLRSLRRLSSNGQNLNRDQTARVLRFAQTLDKATRVFADPKDAEDWMSTPAVGLNWASPLQMLSNPVGFELVDEFLTRMEWGVYH